MGTILGFVFWYSGFSVGMERGIVANQVKKPYETKPFKNIFQIEKSEKNKTFKWKVGGISQIFFGGKKKQRKNTNLQMGARPENN